MATRILIALLFLPFLTGCVTVATGAATETAIVASQERSVSDAGSDMRIQLLADDKLFKYSEDLFGHVNITVTEGRVLLTGNVPKPEDRIKAVQLVWEVPGVRQVQNELQIHESTGVGGLASDSWIIAKLRTQMIWAKDVVSINYNIDCVNGIVYLMGIAQDQDEVDRVIALAKNTSGVMDVVNYVRLKTDLPNPVMQPPPADSAASATSAPQVSPQK